MILLPLIFSNATGLTQNKYTIFCEILVFYIITNLTKSGNGSV